MGMFAFLLSSSRNAGYKKAINFKKLCQKGVLGPWVKQENCSCPEGRRNMKRIMLDEIKR
jgi:hypothetical protein